MWSAMAVSAPHVKLAEERQQATVVHCRLDPLLFGLQPATDCSSPRRSYGVGNSPSKRWSGPPARQRT